MTSCTQYLILLISHSPAAGDIPGFSLFTSQYPHEALFRSVHYALMDHACREYLFVIDFFKMPQSGAMDIFQQVLGKTLELLQVRHEKMTVICTIHTVMTT